MVGTAVEDTEAAFSAVPAPTAEVFVAPDAIGPTTHMVPWWVELAEA